jgi:hypothetical protein
MLERQLFLSEGNGRNATVRFFKHLGKVFKESGRVADFVVYEGPHAQIRLISAQGFMIDVERFMNRTISVTRTDSLTVEKPLKIREEFPIKTLALIKLLQEQFPLPEKVS